MKQSCSFQNLHVIKQFYSFSYLYVLVLTNQKTFSVRSHVRSNVRFFNVRFNVKSNVKSNVRFFNVRSNHKITIYRRESPIYFTVTRFLLTELYQRVDTIKRKMFSQKSVRRFVGDSSAFVMGAMFLASALNRSISPRY